LSSRLPLLGPAGIDVAVAAATGTTAGNTAAAAVAGTAAAVVDTAAAAVDTVVAVVDTAAAVVGTAAAATDMAAVVDMDDTVGVGIVEEGMTVRKHTLIPQWVMSSVGQISGIVGAGTDYGLVAAGQRWRYRQNSQE
jgi:hypothetical protein